MSDSTDRPEPREVPTPASPSASSRRSRFAVYGIVALFVAGAAIAFVVVILPKMRGEEKSSGPQEAAPKLLTVELVKGKPETLFVPEDVRTSLGIEGTYKVEVPEEGRPLLMTGSTAIDPSLIRRLRSRFNGEIMEVTQKPERNPGPDHYKRDLRPGDEVEGGTVLAVVWSVEVGMRKSDLADAIVQLRLDEERLRDRTELWKNGNLPLDLLKQTRRDVITDENSVARAERNLEVWKVPADEIKAVRDEAEAAYLRQGARDKDKEKLWARSAIVAPIGGTILEDNIGGVGEFLPDSTVNLFTIADVKRLQVIAYPPEDMLPELTAVDPRRLRWTIKTVGAEPVDAAVEDISYILEPNQHTAIMKGYINNPGRKLRSGQSLSAAVKMPPPKKVVEIPLSALAEDGRMSFVFVQTDPQKQQYTMRRVQVVRRFEDTAYIRSELSDEERKLNEEDQKQGLPPRQPLAPKKDRILTSGVLELRAALDDLMSKAAQEK